MAGTAVTEPPPPWRRRVTRSMPVSSWTIVTVLFFAAVAAFYVWTAATTALSMHFDTVGSRYYGLLADALRHGQLALRIEPPRELLDLPNPYDPAANQSFREAGRLWDLSLRNGHLYAPWGPTAAIVLFAPFQLVGIQIPESFAVALFGFLGFLFSAMTLRFLVRRFLPGTPRWALAAATVFLAFGNSVPFVLRRPSFYEVAITCGLCFVMLGLWLLVTGWFGPRPSRRRLAGAGLCFGLALLSRPTLGALAIVPLALAAWPRAALPEDMTRRQALVASLAPIVACGVLFAAYNFARFGSPLEFGQKYQLAGLDPATLKSFDPSFIPSGLFLYVLAPPRPMALFPFVQLSSAPALPWAVPEGFIAPEATGGALILTPVLLWILLLPFVVRRMAPDLRRLLLGLIGAGAVILFVLSFVLPGTTQRYTIDFIGLFSLAALLGWLVALAQAQAERGNWRRRLVAGSGLLVLAWGSAVGLALGFTGYYGLFAANHHPKLFYQLQDAFSPISALETRVAGRPVIGMISSPVGSSPGKMTWGSLGDGDGGSFYFASPPGTTAVTVAVPRSGIYHLQGAIGPGEGAVADAVRVAVISYGDEPDHKLKVSVPRRFDVPLKLKAGVSRITWAVASQKSGSGLLLVQGLTIAGPHG